MARQARPDSAEDQRAKYGSASIRGDQKSQVQRFPVDLFDEHRLDHAAVDRIQEISGHDHEDDGQHQLIVVDEPQPSTQLVEVFAARLFFLLLYRLVDVDGHADDSRRNKKGCRIQPEYILGAHQGDQQAAQRCPDQACSSLDDVKQGRGAFDRHLRHLGQLR